MEQIELTKEHKSRLLEMCNKLFNKEGTFFKVLDEDIYHPVDYLYNEFKTQTHENNN